MKKFTYLFIFLLLILICTTLVILTKNILFVLIFVLIIYIIFLKIKIKNKNFEIKNLTYICDTTRSFKHDFNNIMQAMGGYIKTNDMYNLKEYYNKIMPECFHVENLYRFHSKLIVNSALYSIIADKYNLAEKNNIKMFLNITSDISQINLDSYNLCKILGILLDNAIEASEKSPQKIINLSFCLADKKQQIIIENTYLNKNISTKKIFEKGFSTKTSHSGLGLWEIQKIIEKNKNLNLQTKANPDFFVQKLEIL